MSQNMFKEKILTISRFLKTKKRGLVLRFYRTGLFFTGNPRPTSYPVVTGDSFRALANHIHDETTTFLPAGVSAGDIVFVSQDKALWYLQEMHPNILVPYILIVHNGDQTFDERYTSFFDDKIIHCYAQNVSVVHEKVTPIPIGLANFHHFVHTDAIYRTPPIPFNIDHESKFRKNKFFYRFDNRTCPSVRVPLRALCDKHPLMETVREYVSESGFIELLKKYKFLISPRGNAIDNSHRVYEAFHLGIIPVVQDSIVARELYRIGLPFLIVKEWSELLELNEENINEKYRDLMKYAKFDSLNMDYWIAKIKKNQINIPR